MLVVALLVSTRCLQNRHCLKLLAYSAARTAERQLADNDLWHGLAPSAYGSFVSAWRSWWSILGPSIDGLGACDMVLVHIRYSLSRCYILI